MGDSQGSRNLNFLEGSLLGKRTTNVRSTVENPGIIILKIFMFLAEKLSIQPSTDSSPQGSIHSKFTPEHVQEVPVPSHASSVMPVVMSRKDVFIDGSTIKFTTFQKRVKTQTSLNLKSERANLLKRRNTMYMLELRQHIKNYLI
jgi:hypothetical protein